MADFAQVTVKGTNTPVNLLNADGNPYVPHNELQTAIDNEANFRQEQIDEINDEIKATNAVLAGAGSAHLTIETLDPQINALTAVDTANIDVEIPVVGKTFVRDDNGVLGVYIGLGTGEFEGMAQILTITTSPPPVSGVRSSDERSGIVIHCVNKGELYSYFTGESNVTEEITIDPTNTFELANIDDFPELGHYQGVPLIEMAYAFSIDSGGLTTKSLFIMIGNSGISIMNIDESPLVIPVGTTFTFNKMLILGAPDESIL